MNPRVHCFPPTYSDAHAVRIKTVISLPWISCGDNFPLSLLPQSQRITCTRSLTVPVFPGWTSSVSKTDFAGSLENQLHVCVTCREARGSVDSLRCKVECLSTGCVCWPCHPPVSQIPPTPTPMLFPQGLKRN